MYPIDCKTMIDYAVDVEPTYMLTQREISLLQLLADGHCQKQAGLMMPNPIKRQTVKNTLAGIHAKLGAPDTLGAIVFGFRQGWLK